MISVGYYNGTIAPLEELTIPALDRVNFFGDGCYDAAPFTKNRTYAIEDHFDRFYNSCSLLEIRFPMEREELGLEIQKVIDASELDHGMIYWQATRGTAMRIHKFPGENVKPNLFIMAVPLELTPLDFRYHLLSVEDTRFLHCNIKTLNLIPGVIAAQRAEENGCHEVVFHRGERVTEGAHSNILMLKDGVLCTPPRDNLILPGIGLKHLIELAGENGIPVREAPFTLEELRNADEILVSASSVRGVPAEELDGAPVGGKDPATLGILQKAYVERYDAYIKAAQDRPY